MNKHLLKYVLVSICVLNAFNSLSATCASNDSIFEGIKESYELQKKFVNWDLYKETSNNYEHIPHLCVQTFLRAIKDKWDYQDSTLVFFNLSELSKLQNYETTNSNHEIDSIIRDEYPFTVYPPYEGVDLKELLKENNLLIQVSCNIESIRFTVKINAAIISDDCDYIIKESITYEFNFAFDPGSGTNREKNLAIKQFKQDIKENADTRLTNEGVFVFNTKNRFFCWKFLDLEILAPKKVSFEDATLSPQSIFNYWE